MSKQEAPTEMIRRVMAVAQILATVATEEDFRSVDHEMPANVIPLWEQDRVASDLQPELQEVRR